MKPKHRIIEHKRDLLADNVKKAKGEFNRGEVRKGTVDDLMKELSN